MKHKLVSWGPFAAVAAIFSSVANAAPPSVEMTWMSIANWYFKVGDKRIVMDGYISRLPENLFTASPVYANDVYAYTKEPAGVDVASITKVRDAMLGTDKLDLLVVGHSHWDHSWDTPTWAKLTGAPMIGGSSTCMQAAAQGVAGSQCRSVSGGEKISLGDGITMRVVRWNHSGDSSNPIQHFARELYRPPIPDPKSGGLRAGVGEDYPNGGGNRAYLFTVDSPEGQLSFFVSNSASAFDLDKDIVVDGVNFGPPLGNLAAAMTDAGLTKVDAWIGTGGKPVAEMVVPVIHPKTYLPSHWDGLFNAFWPGMPYPFKDDALKGYLDGQKVSLVAQTQYFDKYILSSNGVVTAANHDVKNKLGFADTKRFSQSLLDAVTHVSSTSVGDDCGEGFQPPSDWAKTFAELRQFGPGQHADAVGLTRGARRDHPFDPTRRMTRDSTAMSH
ncbi:MBL fold metallo-hydrolase [Roseateles sp. P5_E1]